MPETKYPVTRLSCSKCGHEFGIMLLALPGIEVSVVCPKCLMVGTCEKKEEANG